MYFLADIPCRTQRDPDAGHRRFPHHVAGIGDDAGLDFDGFLSLRSFQPPGRLIVRRKQMMPRQILDPRRLSESRDIRGRRAQDAVVRGKELRIIGCIGWQGDANGDIDPLVDKIDEYIVEEQFERDARIRLKETRQVRRDMKPPERVGAAMRRRPEGLSALPDTRASAEAICVRIAAASS